MVAIGERAVCSVGILGVSLWPRDDSTAHGLAVVLVSRVRRHRHCSLISCSFRHHSPLRCSSRQVVHVRLLPERRRGCGTILITRRLIHGSRMGSERLRSEAISVQCRSSSGRIRPSGEGSLLILPRWWWSPLIQSLWLPIRHSIRSNRLRHVRRRRSSLRWSIPIHVRLLLLWWRSTRRPAILHTGRETTIRNLARPHRRSPWHVSRRHTGHRRRTIGRKLRRRAGHRLASPRRRRAPKDIGESGISLGGRGGPEIARSRRAAVVAPLLGLVLSHAPCPWPASLLVSCSAAVSARSLLDIRPYRRPTALSAARASDNAPRSWSISPSRARGVGRLCRYSLLDGCSDLLRAVAV